MPAGLQIWGSHGVLQIDETYRNFVVVASGSKAPGDWSVAGDAYSVQIVVASTVAPLVAFRCAQQVGLAYTAISGTTWTLTFLTNTPATLDYWVFDVAGAASSSASYLEVFDDAGARVFDAGHKPLRVVGVGGGTYTSGRTYAAIQAAPSFAYVTAPSGLPYPEEYTYYSSISSAAVVSNVVTLGDVTTANGYVINDAGSFSSPVGQVLVVDVTHF